MNKRITCSCLMMAIVVCGALMARADDQAAGPNQTPKKAAPSPVRQAPPPLASPTIGSATGGNTLAGAKVVAYSQRDLIAVNTKTLFTTLIVLPKNEQILDFTCGDKEFWAINGNQNFAYVKPAKAGAQTNLNLVTASGNVYSFVLSEISARAGAQPDLKIFVELQDDSMAEASRSAPPFVAARDVEELKRELDQSREETRQAKLAAQNTIDKGISRFVSNVRFPYRFEAGKKPFFVRAMYNDDRFTYIQARPEETPALYELKDGKPNLVNFDYKNGIYVVDKILDRGYLAIGKKKLMFARED
jgi:type IV secretory pathway VirB9-like protein